MSRGDERIEALFDTLYAPLTRLAFVILGDRGAAEEAVMDAFVKTLSPRWRRRRIEDPHAYLRMVVVNECRSRIRRSSIERRANAEAVGDREVATQLEPLHFDVWQAVRALPERQRICVVLFYAQDMPVAAIADVLDVSEGTVKSQLSKARAKLADALTDLREEVQ